MVDKIYVEAPELFFSSLDHCNVLLFSFCRGLHEDICLLLGFKYWIFLSELFAARY